MSNCICVLSIIGWAYYACSNKLIRNILAFEEFFRVCHTTERVSRSFQMWKSQNSSASLACMLGTKWSQSSVACNLLSLLLLIIESAIFIYL